MNKTFNVTDVNCNQYNFTLFRFFALISMQDEKSKARNVEMASSGFHMYVSLQLIEWYKIENDDGMTPNIRQWYL